MAAKVYTDFDLLLERVGDNYRARVVNSPDGPASNEFTLPFSDDKLENFILRISQGRRTMRNIRPVEVDASREFGGALFHAIFSGEVDTRLRNSITSVEQSGGSLRIRLRLSDAPELVDVPWEYLYDPASRRFLALSVDTPLVRYLDLPGRIKPLTVQPPLNVLVMIASPTDVVQLDVEQEWHRLKSAVADLEQQGQLRLDRLGQATLDELQKQVRRQEYHVFHFIGHGGFDPKSNDGVLMLEDEQGRGKAVSGNILGTLLHDEKTLRLALLNACEGGRTSKTDPFAGVGQSLLQQGVPAVIAMQFEVTDDTAITLAHSFYTALADGYPVDAALTEARKTIFARNAVEWGTPVLYMRSPDGRIFDVATVDAGVKVQNQVTGLLTTGQAALAAKEWDKAQELFQQVLKLDPTNSTAATGLANLPKVHALPSPVVSPEPKRLLSRYGLYGVISLLLIVGVIFMISRLLARLQGSTSQVTITTQVGGAPATDSTTTPQPAPTEGPMAGSANPQTPVTPTINSSLSTLPTITAEILPTEAPTPLLALAPEIAFSLFSARELSASVIKKLSPLERLAVIEIDEEWAKVETADGQVGWIPAQFFTYEGNRERLPPALQIRSVSNRNDLPFIYAEVISYGGATFDFLYRDPHNELSGFRSIAVGTKVIVLQVGDGAKSYESGRWCLVSVVDPDDPEQLLDGWMPLDVLQERKSPYE